MYICVCVCGNDMSVNIEGVCCVTRCSMKVENREGGG